MILYDRNGTIAFWKQQDGTLDPLIPTGVINWMKERNLSYKNVR